MKLLLALTTLYPMFLSVVAVNNGNDGKSPLRTNLRRQLPGVGANQGSARQTPRGKKVQCDDSDFVIPGQGRTLQEIGSTELCGQEVDSCLWYIGLREIDCECGFGIPCPERGEEFCFEGTELSNTIGGGAKNDGSNGLRFWVCDLIEED